MTSAFERTKLNTEKALDELRSALKPIVPSDAVALTCGSYARREATSGSDLDFFVLSPSESAGTENAEWFKTAEQAITRVRTH